MIVILGGRGLIGARWQLFEAAAASPFEVQEEEEEGDESIQIWLEDDLEMIFFFRVACGGGRQAEGRVVKLLDVSINVAEDAGIQVGKNLRWDNLNSLS